MVRPHLQYIEYEVSIDFKVVYLWFTRSSVYAAKLNLKLKPQADDIKISSNFIYVVISPLIDGI
jgi:ABC-type thiamin/hydroxymethylpyrimidine transport system permease subunit